MTYGFRKLNIAHVIDSNEEQTENVVYCTSEPWSQFTITAREKNGSWHSLLLDFSFILILFK